MAPFASYDAKKKTTDDVARQAIEYIFEKIKDETREQSLKLLVAKFFNENNVKKVGKKAVFQSIINICNFHNPHSIFAKKIMKRAQFFFVFRLRVTPLFQKEIKAENGSFELDWNHKLMWIRVGDEQKRFDDRVPEEGGIEAERLINLVKASLGLLNHAALQLKLNIEADKRMVRKEKKIPIKDIRRILNHCLQDNGFIGPEHEYPNMECLPFASLLSVLNFILQDLKSEGGLYDLERKVQDFIRENEENDGEEKMNPIFHVETCVDLFLRLI